jgi:hypothetical protein
VWRASKTTALVTLAVFSTFTVKPYRFTGPHFYGWDDPWAWIFFTLPGALKSRFYANNRLGFCFFPDLGGFGVLGLAPHLSAIPSLLSTS